MKNLLSPSVEKRAIELIEKGVDIIEAVKQALIDESDMIGGLIADSNNFTEKGEAVRDILFERITGVLCPEKI